MQLLLVIIASLTKKDYEIRINLFDIKNKILMEKELKQQWDYKSTPDLADTETARLEALDQAYIDFGNRLVSLIIDQF